MRELEDPTLVQPKCRECGLPIRSTSFEVVTPHYRHEIETPHGVVVSGMSGIPAPRPFLHLNHEDGWLHDDPRGEGPQVFGGRGHVIAPQEFGPRHSHATDYERQMREWRMNELEKKHQQSQHLGPQFRPPWDNLGGEGAG